MPCYEFDPEAEVHAEFEARVEYAAEVSDHVTKAILMGYPVTVVVAGPGYVGVSEVAVAEECAGDPENPCEDCPLASAEKGGRLRTGVALALDEPCSPLL